MSLLFPPPSAPSAINTPLSFPNPFMTFSVLKEETDLKLWTSNITLKQNKLSQVDIKITLKCVLLIYRKTENEK